MATRVLDTATLVTGGNLAAAFDQRDDDRWLWIDIEGDVDNNADLMAVSDHLHLDAIAVDDAFGDDDLPKLDDYGDHLLLVLHGLGEHASTYEIDCFITPGHVVTVHQAPSPAIDALWNQCSKNEALVAGGPDELVARLADVVSRRLTAVVESFDERNEELIEAALRADPKVVADLTAVRRDLAKVRRAIVPQREALDAARRADTPLISEAGRRRFSDAFDVAARASAGLDAARTALAETLDAYRGAEARSATEVSKVLTIYAAVMLPLTLLAGIWGMNFDNLPFTNNENGWWWVVAAMIAFAVISVGVFIAAGWVPRPSPSRTTHTLGRGLIEATRAPVVIVGALAQAPVRPVVRGARRAFGLNRDDDSN